MLKNYNVKGISIFFSNEPEREFNVRFFTVMYFLAHGKTVTKNYNHTAGNILKALKMPEAVKIDTDIVDAIPTGIPTHYHDTIYLGFSK